MYDFNCKSFLQHFTMELTPLLCPPSMYSKEAHPAPIEEARVAPEMHATPTPPLHQVQEENEDADDAAAGPEDTQDAVDSGGRQEE